tara:strand:+ start:161 stop:361 length:201 start_codon:yes stop_codon:yes gene_type:complete
MSGERDIIEELRGLLQTSSMSEMESEKILELLDDLSVQQKYLEFDSEASGREARYLREIVRSFHQD